MSIISTTTRSSTPCNVSIFTVSSFYSATETIFPCLHVRMLHEQCGHISTLTIHESPCPRPYYGWVLAPLGSSTLPREPPRIRCEGMEFHVAIEKDKCKNCKAVLALAAGKTMCEKFGWGRATKRKDPVVRRDRERQLDVGEIVKRRAEWKREVDAWKARRFERMQEEARAKGRI
ncbi:uncharacterized protein LY89DRAFT_673310 [Mollisia scopiformis]|uniref:Uncharacterized protein n=1 Tax=Mollisia scopiformis TaxID=149040 RepID=A0A194WWJ6_MOLSC|nr:uncharacterized protein LY89DRAFT_673310 [Mollisia scopiformis]KUJ12320.1 hypothetical protein LY89DRAFT_673310 [Mollisia scopiformis]